MRARRADARHELHDLDRRLRDRATRSARRRAAASGSCITARAMPDALALAAGQRVGAALRESGEADDVEQLEGLARCRPSETCAATRATPTRSPAARTAGSPSPSGARRGCTPGTPCRCGGARRAARAGRAARGPAVEQDLARGRLDQPVDAADQRGLAGARRADDRGDAARRDLEVDVGAGPACRRRTTSTGAGACSISPSWLWPPLRASRFVSFS